MWQLVSEDAATTPLDGDGIVSSSSSSTEQELVTHCAKELMIV